MGFLDNSSITVDAILTKRGRQILSQGGDFTITKFALSDEEIDYTLYDVTHPNGTDSYGTVIENMSLLEATSNRTNFRSFLVNQSLAGSSVNLELSHTNIVGGSDVSITPVTIGTGAGEDYTFSIENMNVVVHIFNPGVKTITGQATTLKAQLIDPGATTTVTVVGLISGIVNIVTVAVKTTEASSDPPDGSDSKQEENGNYQQQQQQQQQQQSKNTQS